MLTKYRFGFFDYIIFDLLPQKQKKKTKSTKIQSKGNIYEVE